MPPASHSRRRRGIIPSMEKDAPSSPTAKRRAVTIIERMPDDSSFDEILQELAFVRMIDRGVRDADAGRVVSHEKVVDDVKSWSK